VQLPRITRASAIALVLVVASVALFYVSMRQYYHRRTGFTMLINFGDTFYDRSLPQLKKIPHFTFPNSGGYDGQWYAQLAMVPLLRDRAIDEAIDTPPYRARRILFSWTAYLAGFGQPAQILKAYALQNIVAWYALAFLLLRWFPPTTPRNVAPWFGCLFGAGIALSVRNALLEGPSMLVLVLAIIAVERGRTWTGTIVMALSGMGRETNMLGGGLLVDGIPRTWRQALKLAGMLALMVAPFFLWSLYVRSVYPRFSYSNPASFGLPFVAYAQKWASTVSELASAGWNSYARFSLVVLLSMTTQAVYLLWRREWKSPWWRMGVVYALFMPLLSPLVWEGYPGAAVRVMVPMTFAFNVLVSKDRWFWPLVIFGNLSILDGLAEFAPPLITPYL
jgi:hypothetical protein